MWKLSGQERRFWDRLIGMRKRNYLLLFPGLFVLDVEVIKYLPWDAKILTHCVNGFPHQYFELVGLVAVCVKEVPQLFLQMASLIHVDGTAGWAITGTITSMTLSLGNLVVKSIFPMVNDEIWLISGSAASCTWCQCRTTRTGPISAS